MPDEASSLPSLETARLVVRPPRLSDAPALFDYAQDPEVARFTTWEPHRSEDDSRAFLTRVITANGLAGGGRAWAIARRDESRMIGTVSFFPPHPRDRRAEIAYALGRDHWNQGIATEAASAVTAYLFRALGLHRVEAMCEVANTGSARVMEKLGMRREGLLRGYLFNKGRFVDVLLYSVLAEEWSGLGSSGPPKTAR